MHNEEHGGNTAADNFNQPTPQQEEWQRQWEEEWQAEQSAELMDALDTKYLKCTALMVNYVYSYLKLVNEHKIGDVSMSECDAYGMQTLALATSTTIMYCPEEMAQLSNIDLTKIGDEFREVLLDFERNSSNHRASKSLQSKMRYIASCMQAAVQEQYPDTPPSAGPNSSESSLILKYIIEFFRPRYIIPQSLKIAQEMEAMGCGS